jgi:hypothetical protein
MIYYYHLYQIVTINSDKVSYTGKDLSRFLAEPLSLRSYAVSCLRIIG